ncbi:hypothetical protein PUN28_008419 [Cardiocondyla obscurior]|uniref:Uncharacterized protein n=1 Tax=Cardiocondyla obscurior TaxID=286306 RepID=A0AAW2FZP1_9HYME
MRFAAESAYVSFVLCYEGKKKQKKKKKRKKRFTDPIAFGIVLSLVTRIYSNIARCPANTCLFNTARGISGYRDSAISPPAAFRIHLAVARGPTLPPPSPLVPTGSSFDCGITRVQLNLTNFHGCERLYWFH